MYRNITPLILSFFLAFLIVFGTTPIVRMLAFKIGAVDVPKDKRRMHKKPMARLGGLAIFYGFLISILVFNKEYTNQLMGLLIGSSIIVVLGIFDDIFALPAKLKLLGQIVAAAVVVFFGVRINVITNPFFFSANQHLSLGYFAIPVTIIWIVGVTNAINLIDGIDGLAVGVSSIASLSLFFISLCVEGNVTIALITAALAGACFGFMPYNQNPAKIFMGDTGAMFLGFVLSSVSIMGLFKSYATISFIIPILILGLPIFDTTFAIVRRLLKGEHIMKPDRGHLHHRLLDAGYTQKQVVIILYVISAIFGIAGVLLASENSLKALLLIGAVVLILIVAYFLRNFDMEKEESKYMEKIEEKEE